MSGIFGVFNRDATPVSADVLDDMLDAVSYWKPDTTGLWRDGPIGLGHAMLWNTPESKLEALPEQQGSLVVSMDARLDNRDELAPLLGLDDRPLSETKDSEYILAAYRKWGEACPEHLIGDFAFVIWDEDKQQLFCARDHVGVKQFYFHVEKDCFVFSNDLKGLVSHPAVSKEINDEAVANYLVNHQLKSSTLTFFVGVEKLPPAHSMMITGREFQQTCYWRLEDAPKVKLPNMEAYAAKLRELLERAVHDRMRSDYPITSHLSGGLDSSSIAVIAARKLKETGDKLLAFNWLHAPEEGDDPEHYEWANSRRIAKAEGIVHRYVSLTADSVCSYVENQSLVYGDTLSFWYEFPVLEAVHKANSRTILTGWGGDELATYHGQSYFSDLICKGRFIRAFRSLKKFACKQNKKCTRRLVSLMYHDVFLVLMPRSWYQFMPRHRNTNRSVPFFVHKLFFAAIEKEFERTPVLTAQPQRTIRQHMLAYWENGHLQSRITSWASQGLSKKVEYAYPLLDKRLLEFVVGVPAECFVHNNFGRYLIRLAAEGLLPDEILWSDDKAENERVEQLFSLGYSVWQSLLMRRDAANRKSDYLDVAGLYKAIDKIQQGGEMSLEMNQLNQNIKTAMLLLYSDELQSNNSIDGIQD